MGDVPIRGTTLQICAKFGLPGGRGDPPAISPTLLYGLGALQNYLQNATALNRPAISETRQRA